MQHSRDTLNALSSSPPSRALPLSTGAPTSLLLNYHNTPKKRKYIFDGIILPRRKSYPQPPLEKGEPFEGSLAGAQGDSFFQNQQATQTSVKPVAHYSQHQPKSPLLSEEAYKAPVQFTENALFDPSVLANDLQFLDSDPITFIPKKSLTILTPNYGGVSGFVERLESWFGPGDIQRGSGKKPYKVRFYCLLYL